MKDYKHGSNVLSKKKQFELVGPCATLIYYYLIY